MIDVPNYENDWCKSSRALLKIHNFLDFAANVQSMINYLSFETITRVPAQLVWKWQANKINLLQDALQKNWFRPKKGSSFHVLLTSINQVLNIEVWHDKTITNLHFRSSSFRVIKVYNKSVRSKESVWETWYRKDWKRSR